MPLQATSGAASYDAFGGGAAAVPVFIEDTFSTTLYTGNSSTQTITNGIDLSSKGGLVWIKRRTDESHYLFDTNRGALAELATQATEPSETKANSLTSFNSDGFSLGSWGGTNYSVAPYNTYASWTFRKQPKFFDVVTFTSASSGNTTFSHNLGSVPGCVLIKNTQTSDPWIVYHRSTGDSKWLYLNATDAAASDPNIFSATSTTFTIKNTFTYANQSYVAYLFAHNAGGFGLTGTDNVISCGSYTGNGSTTGPVIDLGYEPQWVMIKRTDSSTNGNWQILDIMRGMSVAGTSNILYANLSGDESASSTFIIPTATGFQLVNTGTGYNASGGTYIYIAIRRGPMKVPTSGTSVFEPVAYTGDGTNNRIITSSITPDSIIPAYRNTTGSKYWYDRLRGNGTYLITTGTNAEGTDGAVYGPQFNKVQTGYQQGTSDSGFLNNSSYTYINYLLRRAPSVFDEVCYTGTGSATTFTHNLGVVPELMIVKTRTESGRGWAVYAAPLGATKWLRLELTNAEATASTLWNNTAPTSSVFTVGTSAWTNNNTQSFVNYLFATCAGVSKVFSYTGNGSSQTINCGFTSSARFVLIKRTDSTGDWYVWDSARGIVSGNDPHLSLNTTAAEVTSDDTIDTDSTGFVVNQVSATDVNVSSATYIGLAIA